MFSRIARIAQLGFVAGVSLTVLGSQASADPYYGTYADDYFGGSNTWGGTLSTGPDGVKDIIGSSPPFAIVGMDVSRVDTGGGHNDLVVTVYTNYAGNAGRSIAAGTGYGDLFIRSQGAGALSLTGPAPYTNDTYSFGRFDYVFDIARTPGSGDRNGTGALFEITDPNDVQLSWGNNTSDTVPGPSTWFRGDQAVEYKGSTDDSVKGGTYAVDEKTTGDKVGTITFTITDEDNMFGSSFWLAWAMTCANDIILVNASVPELIDPPQVPLPAAFPLFAAGLGVIGLVARRRKKQAA